MSSSETTDKKMPLPLPEGGGESRPENRRADSDRHISFTLAHELNNVLTVVQGHADRLFSKHQEDAALGPSLKLISDAAHRASELVRSAPKLDINPPAAV
jgi:signal transduction histidine kinase